MSTEHAKPKELPRAIVIGVVVATGAATIWAATKAGPLGPYTSWDRAQQAVQQIWPGTQPGMPMMPQPGSQPTGAAPTANPQVAPSPAPASPTPSQAAGQAAPQAAPSSTSQTIVDPLFPPASDSAARTVGLPGVPTIGWGTSRPHRDRGPCVNCHSISMGGGQRVPTIFSFSAMPHEYRGVCNNCHQISVAGFGGNLVGGIRQTAPLDALLQGQAAMGQAAMGQAAMPNEVEWLGIEGNASSQGVVVTKVDGTATRAGVQPGDVVESINGMTIQNTSDFNQVTQNGKLTQATMIARRNTQRLAFQMQKNQGAPAAASQQPSVSSQTGGAQQQMLEQNGMQ